MKEIVAAIVTSNAANKLADTIQGVSDYIAGPKRIVDRARANAEAQMIGAAGELKIEELRQISADRTRSLEERRAANTAAIICEAYVALPGPETPVDAQPVSDDFLLRFFGDAQNVSDAQMQGLWARLLAGEVIRPGSYHPSTLSALRDMRKDDAESFAELCRLAWVLETEVSIPERLTNSLTPLPGLALKFDHLIHFEGLGLLRLETGGLGSPTFAVGDLPSIFEATYCGTAMRFKLPEGKDEISTGSLLLTQPGAELSKLVTVEPVPGHLEKMLERWRGDGVEIEIIRSN